MSVSPDVSFRLALDAQSLDQLRSQAKLSPDQALKAVAQQFESVFINMLLKSMRDATPQDGLFDSEQTRMFTGMLDQQLSQTLASRGVGLADMMVMQLRRSGNAGVDAAEIPEQIGSRNIKNDFVQRMAPHALSVSRSSGIPAQLMLGQAALESGWGRHEIRMPDGSRSHNLFGIKAGDSWQGRVAIAMTTEYENGVAIQREEKFRAYSTYADAFQDYAKLIGGNPRYTKVMQQASEMKQNGEVTNWGQLVQQAGYATDPLYAEKLEKILVMTGDILVGAGQPGGRIGG